MFSAVQLFKFRVILYIILYNISKYEKYVCKNMHLKQILTSIFHLGKTTNSFLYGWLPSVVRYWGALELNWSGLHEGILWERSNQISLYCRPCLSEQDTAQTLLECAVSNWSVFSEKRETHFTAFQHLSTKNQMSACSHLRDKNLADTRTVYI